MDADNWALVTDLYELTMANGFKEKLGEEEGVCHRQFVQIGH